MTFLSFFSPLEQFEILPLFVIRLGILDLSITNQTILLILIFFFVNVLFFACLNLKDQTLYIIPTRWQSIIEIFYNLILSMVVDNVSGKKSQLFFPLIFCIFFLLLL